MESKVPFIAEYDPYSKTRPLKQWRPRSTRPWTISLFLAATGICFGLLMLISLIEKEPTTVSKRDVYSNSDNVYERHALPKRIATTCSSYTIVTVTSTACIAPSGHVCPTTTARIAPVTTNPCATTITTVTSSYLVLTTQNPTTRVSTPTHTSTASSSDTNSALSLTTPTAKSSTKCVVTVAVYVTLCIPLSGYACPPGTATASTTIVGGGNAGTGSCSSVTMTQVVTETGSYLALSSQCTTTVTKTLSLCSPPSGYACPPTSTAATAVAASTGSCVSKTVTVYFTIASQSYLALSSQCTTYTVKTLTVCSPPSGYTCAPTTSVQAPAATTGPCVTKTATAITSNTAYLILSKSDPTTYSAMTTSKSHIELNTPDATPTTTLPGSTQKAIPSTIYTQGPTSRGTNTPSSPSPSQGSITSVPFTVQTTTLSTMIITTGLPVASPSTRATGILSSASPISSSASSVHTYSTAAFTRTDSSAYLSFTVQSSVSGFASVESSISSVYLSLTEQETRSSAGQFSSQSSTTPVYTSSGLAPFINSLTQGSSSISGIGPVVNPTAYATSTTPSPGSTETLSLSLGEETTLLTNGATYLFVASTDGIHSSLLFAEQTGNSVATTTMSSTSTSAQATSTGVLNKNFVVIKLQPFEPYHYFLALYLPKILAVIMTTLWTVIFAGLKLMEPFYQLSANTGAFASESMFGNYLASELNTSSLSAAFSGRWVLLLAGLILMVWAAIVALISESMAVVSRGTCTDLNHPELGSHRCDPAWAVNEPILKVLLALTGLAFVLVLVLMLILAQRKRTGLYHDPSSIAAMAELLGNPMVMEDLQAIKPSSSDREVKLLLGENRYRIGLYDASTGKDASFSTSDPHELRWGLIKLDQTMMTQTIADRRMPGYSAVLNPSTMSTEEFKANRKRRIFQLIYDCVMLLTALCIFALVLGYWLDSSHDPMNDFFNSDTFGPRFVLTCLALILSMGWRNTSQGMTVMAPYRAMARAYEAQSGVPAGRSILAPIAHTPWTALFKGVRLRYYMVTMVALCSVLAEILLIAVSGVPYHGSQMILSLKICVFVSLSILGIMILTSLAVIVYNRTSAGGTRRLPRSPNTLAGVWLYLCHSKLANQGVSNSDDFSSPLDGEGLIAKYEKYQYGFARKTGAGWTIDTEIGLRSLTLLPTQQYRNQNHLADDDTEYRGSQPFEASATPVEGPRGHQLQEPLIQRTPSRHQPQSSPYGTAYFEAQAKSPVAQTPAARFEELRPRPQVVQVTPTPQPRPVRRQETALSPQEAFMQWEYEQEFHNPRRTSASSGYTSEPRWTNDGRSQYRYG